MFFGPWTVLVHQIVKVYYDIIYTHKAIDNVFIHSKLRRWPVTLLDTLECVVYRFILHTRMQPFKDPKIQGSSSKKNILISPKS